MTAQVPFMITAKMRADLKSAGYTPAQISQMNPTEAWEALGGMPQDEPQQVAPVATQQENEPLTQVKPTPPNMTTPAGAVGIKHHEALTLAKLIDGQNVNGAVDRLPEDLQEIAQAILATPPSRALRSAAFDAAISGRQDKNDLAGAVIACNPAEELTDGRPKTFDDLALAMGPIEWAWFGWLPRGFLTILAATPGIGKSALALAICDCFLRGKPWPDFTRPTDTDGVILWAEAESAQAINLERATEWGMPRNRILLPLPTIFDDIKLTIPEHRAALVDMAIRPEVKLIVLDSLSGADPGIEKSVEDADSVRFLAALAREVNKPILAVHHLRKKGLTDGDEVTLDRLRGTSAIAQAARVIWALDRPDSESEWVRLSVIKSNLGKAPEPLGMLIDDKGVKFGASPVKPKIDGPQARAIDLLRSLLQKEPVLAKDIISECEQAGISSATMNRAKEKLSIQAIKKGKIWYWSLPARDIPPNEEI